jgi:hypothetical protein
LHTPQIGWNEKLKDWMVWDGMGSIVFHSIPFIFCKFKQWKLITYHHIPFHSFTYHQSKHSLKDNTWLVWHSLKLLWYKWIFYLCIEIVSALRDGLLNLSALVYTISTTCNWHQVRKLSFLSASRSIFSKCMKVSPMLHLLLTSCNHQWFFYWLIFCMPRESLSTLNNSNPPPQKLHSSAWIARQGKINKTKYDILTDICA